MTNNHDFASRLESFSRVRRGLVNAVTGYRLGGFMLVVGILMLLSLGGWLPNAFVNFGLFVLGFFSLAALGVAIWRRWQRFASHLAEAFCVEALAKNLNSRLVSGLDFLGHESPTPLMGVVIDQAAGDLQADFERHLDRRERDRRRRQFAMLLILFVALGLTPWFGFARLAANFRETCFAVREYLFPTLYELQPGPGEHVCRLGVPVEVSVRFIRRGYREVTLVDTLGEAVNRRRLTVDDTGEAVFTYLPDAPETHKVFFEFGERRSESMTLVFTTPPTLENMQTEIFYPPYTRRMPRDLEGIQSRFVGLPGTRISLGFQFSKELAAATLTWDDGEEVALDTMGRFARVRLVQTASRHAKLQVEDTHGLQLEYPHEMSFRLQADEKPRVYLPGFLKEDMPFTVETLNLFSFGVRLQDDYGVSRCVLKWNQATIDDPSNVTRKGEVDRLVSPPRAKAIQSFEKIFGNLPVQPGDRISFKMEVYDNRTPTPQISTSATVSLFVYQQNLADLAIAGVDFGQGGVIRQRIKKAKRSTTVKEPAGTRRLEAYQNPFDAAIEIATKAPRVGGPYAKAVNQYFELMSTVTLEEDSSEKEEP